MELTEQVQRAIARAGVTVIGVSIGRVADKATWRVDHLPTATQADRDAAAAAVAAFDPVDTTVVADAQTTEAQMTSRHKDILATVAWAIQFKDPAAWTAKTTPQKKTQVLAEADNWRDIRVFVEKNF